MERYSLIFASYQKNKAMLLVICIYSVGRNSITRLNAQKEPPSTASCVGAEKKTYLQKMFPGLVKNGLSITFSNFCP